MVFQEIPGSSAGAATVLRSSRFPAPSSNYVFANNLKKARNFTSCLTLTRNCISREGIDGGSVVGMPCRSCLRSPTSNPRNSKGRNYVPYIPRMSGELSLLNSRRSNSFSFLLEQRSTCSTSSKDHDKFACRKSNLKQNYRRNIF